MKLSAIKNSVDIYLNLLKIDKASLCTISFKNFFTNNFFNQKSDVQILLEFYENLPKTINHDNSVKDRDLTEVELYQLMLILLQEKTSSGTPEKNVFNRIKYSFDFKLMKKCISKYNDKKFIAWFEKEFVAFKNGIAGIFVQAERLAENGNYAPAKKYLEEILTATHAKIATYTSASSKKKKKHKTKKQTPELVLSENNNEVLPKIVSDNNSEISSPNTTIPTTPEAETTALLDSPTLAKTPERSSFSHMRALSNLFSDCCPTFFTRRVREEDTEMDNINPLKLTEKEISYKKL